MKIKAQEREMKGRRKKLIVVKPLPAMANTSPQQLRHIFAHQMRQRSGFFTIIIVLTRLRNNVEDFDALTCMQHALTYFTDLLVF
jgi:hypothetical protein